MIIHLIHEQAHHVYHGYVKFAAKPSMREAFLDNSNASVSGNLTCHDAQALKLSFGVTTARCHAVNMLEVTHSNCDLQQVCSCHGIFVQMSCQYNAW